MRVEEELQQISVELEPKCDVEIVAPEEHDKEEAASSACAIVMSTATIEVETASQASEPASQASDEDDVPVTDIYFVRYPLPGPLGMERRCVDEAVICFRQ